MTNILKGAALAATLAVAPLAASAATLTPGGSFGINDADVYSFQLDAVNGTAGDSFTFEFTNAGNSDTQVAVTLATVAQFMGEFAGGVQFSWASGESASFAEGEDGSATFDTTIDANGANTLTVDFGDFSGGGGDIDFFVAAVPLPAGGLLLLSAFGAVAVARRKKTA